MRKYAVKEDTAKILKEVEYDWKYKYFYANDYGLSHISECGEMLITENKGALYDVNGEFGIEEGEALPAPTLQEVVDWLWTEAKIWVNVDLTYGGFAGNLKILLDDEEGGILETEYIHGENYKTVTEENIKKALSILEQ